MIQVNTETQIVCLDTETDVYAAYKIIAKHLALLGYAVSNQNGVRPHTTIGSVLGKHLLAQFLDSVPLLDGEHLLIGHWAENLITIMYIKPDIAVMKSLEILPRQYSYGLQFTDATATETMSSTTFMRKLYLDVVNANKGEPNYAAMLFLGAVLENIPSPVPSGVRMRDGLQEHGYNSKYGLNTFKIWFDDHTRSSVIITTDVDAALELLARNKDTKSYYYRHTGRISGTPILLGPFPYQNSEYCGHLATDFSI